MAVCALPAVIVIAAAASAVPVAAKVTDGAAPDVTVSTLLPAVVPNFQLVTVAMPLVVVAVVNVRPETEPPPVVTVNVTTVPSITKLLAESLTRTDGAIATALLTIAL